MAFCEKCGAPVEGAFCSKCGTQISASGLSSAQAEKSVTPIPPPPLPAAPASKKRSPLLWILVGCLGLIVIVGIIVVSTGVFIFHKAGLDPTLMKQNPGLAVAKMMATMNPDIEVLSVDEGRGIISVRDKKTGKTMTMNLKDAQKGKIVFQDDQNKNVEIQSSGEGNNAAVEITSSEGTVRVGANTAIQLPGWLPTYPGSKTTGTFSFGSKDGNAGSFAFKTDDAVEKVASYYETALKNAGFAVERNTTEVSGKSSLVVLAAEDKNTQRNANVTVAGTEEGTTVHLSFETRK